LKRGSANWQRSSNRLSRRSTTIGPGKPEILSAASARAAIDAHSRRNFHFGKEKDRHFSQKENPDIPPPPNQHQKPPNPRPNGRGLLREEEKDKEEKQDEEKEKKKERHFSQGKP
jgi:hypothetical protein